MSIKVVTNNPKVLEYAELHSIDFISKLSIPEVLKGARDLIHKNYKLINHPLVTSIKPYSNLYKTVVLEATENLDFQSLDIMENSIIKAGQFQREIPLKKDAETDYQTIDFGVFQEVIEKN